MFEAEIRAAEGARDALDGVLVELEGARADVAIEGFEGWEGPASEGARARLLEARVALDTAFAECEDAYRAVVLEVGSLEALSAPGALTAAAIANAPFALPGYGPDPFGGAGHGE